MQVKHPIQPLLKDEQALNGNQDSSETKKDSLKTQTDQCNVGCVLISSYEEYTKDELREIVAEVSGRVYMEQTNLPRAVEKTASDLFMMGESMSERACKVRKALSDLRSDCACFKYTKKD
ncbi:hypothetical protein [Vibrio sp. D431a]|uniref:hypothetical protein n=1 Tax=Vibrio sp. D431a TaxID=2837388 RepID=UPI002553AC18|nr:hypothetical protein [Vibrio sp. D431a]MDK9793332.1 hypothetical protein [Vibrio sp. D431a]